MFDIEGEVERCILIVLLEKRILIKAAESSLLVMPVALAYLMYFLWNL